MLAYRFMVNGHTQNLLPSISLKSSHVLLSKCTQKHCEGTSVPCIFTMVSFHSPIHEKMLRKQWSRAWSIQSEHIARTPLIVLCEHILVYLVNVTLNTTLSTASSDCHYHCSASSTAFSPLFSLTPKAFAFTETLTTIQYFWTWQKRFLHRKTEFVQICGRPVPIWKPRRGKEKENEFCVPIHSLPTPLLSKLWQALYFPCSPSYMPFLNVLIPFLTTIEKEVERQKSKDTIENVGITVPYFQ